MSVAEPILAVCGTRERLIAAYMSAIVNVSEAGFAIADMKSEAWREATKETREACRNALEDLNSHRKEHGC
jgi:hypothetical protein